MAIRRHVTFENSKGNSLSATLELPAGNIKYYALFAHCFSCGKDVLAASRISRALAAMGIAVLRFDFTGIGDSEGDFADTNFSSNIADVQSAADFLREHYQAPKLLIGHSLGGTAVMHAASKIDECKAVATIAAPATPNHILSHFPNEVKALESDAAVTINIGGKSLTIKQQFVADLEAQSTTNKISELRKALLIFHAPLDDIVSIDEASRIFIAAKHPKSFITLDKADHLLSDASDADYVANTISAWASRYIDAKAEQSQPVHPGELFVGEGNQKFLREVSSDDHNWLSDEPVKVGGDNLGPDPYEQLLASLGTCTSMTLRMYANHKGWPVNDIKVQLKHARTHREDCEQPDNKQCKVEVLDKTVTIEGDLDESQQKRLKEVADRCPVHKTLLGELEITSNFNFVE